MARDDGDDDVALPWLEMRRARRRISRPSSYEILTSRKLPSCLVVSSLPRVTGRRRMRVVFQRRSKGMHGSGVLAMVQAQAGGVSGGAWFECPLRWCTGKGLGRHQHNDVAIAAAIEGPHRELMSLSCQDCRTLLPSCRPAAFPAAFPAAPLASRSLCDQCTATCHHGGGV